MGLRTPALEHRESLAQYENLQAEVVAGAKEGAEVDQNCKSKLDHAQRQIGIELLASALKDHAVVFVAQPKSGPSKVVELGTNRCNKPSFFGQAVDTGCSNHVGARGNREPDSVAVVHQQRLGTKFRSEHDGFTLARMQTGQAEPICLRGVCNGLHGQPRSHRSLRQGTKVGLCHPATVAEGQWTARDRVTGQECRPAKLSVRIPSRDHLR